MNEPIRLTQYSHGAGCGCKISPQVLEVILAGSGAQNLDPNLWVGNASRDDAAVYAIDDERGVVSTTDFFMPIVDDPFDFGRIAATNAISDIYAMGGDPLMAIAILGWPVNVLGIGILTTAEKKGKLREADIGLARDWMCTLNKPGSRFGKLAGVTAMTDVTGFGLLGHLVEMADGSGLTARIDYAKVPRLPGVEYYLDQGCVPGGTLRNFESYASKLGRVQELHKRVLCDPQTSGGLLIAVTPEGDAEFHAVAAELGLALEPIGELLERQTNAVEVI